MTEPTATPFILRVTTALTGTGFLTALIAAIPILGIFDGLTFNKPRHADPIDTIAGESLGIHLFSSNGVFGFFRVSANKWVTNGNEPDRALESQFYGGVVNLTIVHINHPGSHRAHRELRFSYFGVISMLMILLILCFAMRAKPRLSPS